jgi:hypothetical protein
MSSTWTATMFASVTRAEDAGADFEHCRLSDSPALTPKTPVRVKFSTAPSAGTVCARDVAVDPGPPFPSIRRQRTLLAVALAVSASTAAIAAYAPGGTGRLTTVEPKRLELKSS